MNVVEGGDGGLSLAQGFEAHPGTSLGSAGLGIAHDLDLDESAEGLEDGAEHIFGANGGDLTDEEFSFLGIDFVVIVV